MEQGASDTSGLKFLQTTAAPRRNPGVSLVRALLKLLSLPCCTGRPIQLCSPAVGRLFTCTGEAFSSSGFHGHIPYPTVVVPSRSTPQLSNLSLVWRFLAVPTSQVHVSKALRRQAHDGKITLVRNKEYPLGIQQMCVQALLRQSQVSGTHTHTTWILLEGHHVPIHQMSSAVLTKEGPASRRDRMRPQMAAAP